MELARETVIEDRRPRSVVVEVVGTGSTIDHIDRINFSHEEDGVLHLITKLLNTDCLWHNEQCLMGKKLISVDKDNAVERSAVNAYQLRLRLQ